MAAKHLRRSDRGIIGKPIVIIGGGISGLAAADRLLARGIPIKLLEASERLGGRIHTIPDGGTPIELGAEFIHGRSEALLAALKKARLSIRAVPNRHQLFSDGKGKAVDFFQVVEKVLAAVDPRRPDSNFQTFLKRRRLPARVRQIARDYVEGFQAAHAERIGAHSLIRAQYAADQMRGAWQGRVVNGYSDLVASLKIRIQKRGGEIIQSAVVDQVDWSPGRVSIGYICDREPKRETGRAAIVTLPLGIWKARTVNFSPAVVEKQRAAEELHFGNVVKIILVFSERWWPKSQTGFIHLPGAPLPTWWPGPVGATLTGWAGGPRAEMLLGMPPPQLAAVCLDTLSRIFPRKATAIESTLQAIHMHDWARDPHIRGAYSYIPVNGLDLPRVLAAPVQDTLFFAGEATVFDGQTGTVFGALESGLRLNLRQTNRPSARKRHSRTEWM